MGKALNIGTRWYLDIMTPAFAPTPWVIYTRTPGSETGSVELNSRGDR